MWYQGFCTACKKWQNRSMATEKAPSRNGGKGGGLYINYRSCERLICVSLGRGSKERNQGPPLQAAVAANASSDTRVALLRIAIARCECLEGQCSFKSDLRIFFSGS